MEQLNQEQFPKKPIPAFLEVDMADPLTRRAIEVDQLAGVAPQPEQPGSPGEPVVTGDIPPPPDYMGEAASIVETCSALAVAFAPPCETVWDQETKGRVSAVLAPVLEYHGFSMGKMPPHIALAFVAGPPVWATSKIIAQYVAEKREAKAKEEAEKAQAEGRPMVVRPTGDPEAPAQAMHPQMALYRK